MSSGAPIRKAVIPAIGRGNCLFPATKRQPQEMMSIIDKPVIQYVVEEAIQSGIQEILIITGDTRGSLEALFGNDFEQEMILRRQVRSSATLTFKGIPDVKIYFTYLTECNGLGHAILHAKQFIDNEPFAVLLCNEIIDAAVPSLKQLFDVYQYYSGTVIGVQEVVRPKVCKSVIVKPIILNDRVLRVIDIIDKPSVSKAPSKLAVFGRYILSPEVFLILEKMTIGHGNQILLMDALRQLALTKPVYAYQLDGRRYDVDDLQGYLEATIEFALKRNDTSEIFVQYLRQSILPIIKNKESLLQ